MLESFRRLWHIVLLFILGVGFSAGCIKASRSDNTAVLLKSEDATREQLMNEVNRFAKVNSIHAKMYLKFEDNSFAESGTKEVYKSADGDVVVQRPSKIYMRVQVPVIKTDVAQMSSDGTKFCVAILQDGGTGKYKKFVVESNSADYSRLQNQFRSADLDNSKALKENVNAFANLRPQHFTDAMLVRPIDPSNVYTQSTIFQLEEDQSQEKKSPIRKVMRGYYLLDEYVKDASGNLEIVRRFWFDRRQKYRWCYTERTANRRRRGYSLSKMPAGYLQRSSGTSAIIRPAEPGCSVVSSPNLLFPGSYSRPGLFRYCHTIAQ